MSDYLSLSNVSYSVARHRILDAVSFSLNRGEIVGLLGVNGAGKSSLLKICAGALLPSAGKFETLVENRARDIGYLPETPPLIKDWSVTQYLFHIAKLHKVPGDKLKQAIERAIELCDLAPVYNKTIKTLSKGNQQRVGIAQAIIHCPKLLILDEPTSGLDPHQTSYFRALLMRLKPDSAIILSTHIMQEVSLMCDRALVINQGKIVSTLDLSLIEKETVIEFSQAVTDDKFRHYKAWLSGQGNKHKFHFATSEDKQAVIAYCLAQGLVINTVTIGSSALEQQFFSALGLPTTVVATGNIDA